MGARECVGGGLGSGPGARQLGVRTRGSVWRAGGQDWGQAGGTGWGHCRGGTQESGALAGLSPEAAAQLCPSPQGQGRERKSSLDLRREIIHVGGIQYLFELRKTRRKRREEKAAPEPEPEPEPEEIVSGDPGGCGSVPAFLRAAVQGKIRVIEKFLGDGGSPDTCDEFHRTALHRASLEGHMEILKTLLDHGAAVDFRDRLDCTAVHWACRGGHLDAVKLLQDRGADLNLKDKLLSTPLHVATRTGQTDIVEHLINTGVDVNSRDREGDSALHDAVRLNRYKIIKMLILYGADMMAQNLVRPWAGERDPLHDSQLRESQNKTQ
uniref:Ankyrin repeat domain 2 n=1 Tax=Gopherus evgoodei TaxID=1825980 RepID=A0A8C4VSZ9_9SAUR